MAHVITFPIPLHLLSMIQRGLCSELPRGPNCPGLLYLKHLCLLAFMVIHYCFPQNLHMLAISLQCDDLMANHGRKVLDCITFCAYALAEMPLGILFK